MCPTTPRSKTRARGRRRCACSKAAAGIRSAVLGTEPGVGTDKQAGRIARFFMSGGSSYLITFTRP
jgi:hypothetical protein